MDAIAMMLERARPKWAFKTRDFKPWRDKGLYLAHPGNVATVNLCDFGEPFAQTYISPWRIEEDTDQDGNKVIKAVFPWVDQRTVGAVYVPGNYAFHIDLDMPDVDLIVSNMSMASTVFRFLDRHSIKVLKEGMEDPWPKRERLQSAPRASQSPNPRASERVERRDSSPPRRERSPLPPPQESDSSSCSPARSVVVLRSK